MICVLDKLSKLKIHDNHKKPISHMSATPDGKQIVSASTDMKVNVWHRRTGHRIISHRANKDDQGIVTKLKVFIDETQNGIQFTLILG